MAAVEYYLERIASMKRLNAFIEVYGEEALSRAQQLNASRKAGQPLPLLHGVVIGIKDVLAYEGHQLTASSRILEGFRSIYTATAVQKLIDQGAIIIGNLNCDEFAMGSTNENSVYGPVLNAADETRIPGGSSGGSAVAVQAGLCMVSLGSDTGGSVRQPADLCGIIGLKPSYGRVSRYGLIAYASSFDQVGIFGINIPDVARTLEVISGPDEFDSTVSSRPVDRWEAPARNDADQQTPEQLAAQQQVPQQQARDQQTQDQQTQDQHTQNERRYRIAFLTDAVDHPSLDPEIAGSIHSLLADLRAEGHTVEGVPFQLIDHIVPAYYVLTTAESSSNLSRYDGIRYGFRSAHTDGDLTSLYKQTRSEGFGTEVKRRIMLGTFVLSAGYFEAYFTRAQKVRKILADQIDLILNDFDFIVLPTTPSTAFRLGEKMEDPIAMYLADIYTVTANLVGIPAISLPLFRHSNGLPFGLQVMTSRFNELPLLTVSNDLMKRRKG